MCPLPQSLSSAYTRWPFTALLPPDRWSGERNPRPSASVRPGSGGNSTRNCLITDAGLPTFGEAEDGRIGARRMGADGANRPGTGAAGSSTHPTNGAGGTGRHLGSNPGQSPAEAGEKPIKWASFMAVARASGHGRWNPDANTTDRGTMMLSGDANDNASTLATIPSIHLRRRFIVSGSAWPRATTSADHLPANRGSWR